MTKTTLRDMADQAKHMLTANPDLRFVHRRLAHGMEWVIERNGQQWRLAAAREDTYPSGMEITILRNAFDVPISIDETRALKTRIHPKTGREITYHTVELAWIDRTLPKQMELIP